MKPYEASAFLPEGPDEGIVGVRGWPASEASRGGEGLSSA